MNRKKVLIFFLISIFLFSCSFDNKTGIWSGKDEEKRIAELEKQQRDEKTISSEKIYSSENTYSTELKLKKEVSLSKPKRNLSWKMHGLNHQNFFGNIYLPGIENIFLKKKIGKNKFSMSNISATPLIHKNTIIISDDRGTIFSVGLDGRVNWKINIYNKSYKKIYKNLTLSIFKNNLYVADNIGFIYALSLGSGKIIWIKNHGVPLKSKIKVFDDKILLINQDNKIFCIKTTDGSGIWNVRSIPSFIKSQNFLSVALSKQGNVIVNVSSGDLLKLNPVDGQVYWTLNSLRSLLAHDTDFFESSDIVIDEENIIFSTKSSISSYKLDSGYANWTIDVNSVATPIIDGDNLFFITKNGFFIIANKENGKIISSNNILKVLKEKKRLTKITGFIMGSGKIYSVTMNGYLIVSSASTGKTEIFKKIGDQITSNPIISDGKLYIYTENSRIFGFN